jgi:hypothetical protein
VSAERNREKRRGKDGKQGVASKKATTATYRSRAKGQRRGKKKQTRDREMQARGGWGRKEERKKQ